MTEIGLKDWPLNTQRGKMKLELPSYSERKGGGTLWIMILLIEKHMSQEGDTGEVQSQNAESTTLAWEEKWLF